MALTTSEEALVRQLLDQQAAILSLAGNEATITSKLGATKVTLEDLVAANGVADADLLLMRQGTTDKSVTPLLLKGYAQDGMATQKGVQAGDYNTSVAAGTADAITADFTPNVALTNGTTVIVRAGVANTTTTPTFSPDGLTAKTIVKGNNLALTAGDIAGAGHWLLMQYDATLDKWVLLNPATGVTSSISGSAFQSQTYTAFTTAGATGAFTLTPTPAIGAYSPDQRFRAKFHAVGNGTDTINVSGLGAKNIKQYNSAGSKVAPVIVANQLADIEYDGTDFVILDPLPVAAVASTRIAKAWVNFDGTLTGTITPRASYNVSSVTKNGTGDYTVNFTAAMTDANYAFSIAGSADTIGVYGSVKSAVAPSTTALRIQYRQSASINVADQQYAAVTIFGN